MNVKPTILRIKIGLLIRQVIHWMKLFVSKKEGQNL